jgi:hypothetical protein
MSETSPPHRTKPEAKNQLRSARYAQEEEIAMSNFWTVVQPTSNPEFVVGLA